MALPTASTAGYGYLYTYTSHPNVGCDCLRVWIPELHRQACKRGILTSPTPRVIQATGMASASAYVHSRGGVFDLPFPDPTRWNSTRRYRILGPKTKAFLMLGREMGAFEWARYDEDGIWNGDPWEGNEHLHGGLNGCPHLHWQAKDQLAEYLRGGDGLIGTASDPFPRPSTFRTWKQGIAWATGTTTTTTTSSTATEEDESMNEAQYEVMLTKFNQILELLKGLPAEVWQETVGDNPATVGQHVLNSNVKAGKAADAATDAKNLAVTINNRCADIQGKLDGTGA